MTPDMHGSPAAPPPRSRLASLLLVVALLVAGIGFAAAMAVLTTRIASPKIGLHGVPKIGELAPAPDATAEPTVTPRTTRTTGTTTTRTTRTTRTARPTVTSTPRPTTPATPIPAARPTAAPTAAPTHNDDSGHGVKEHHDSDDD